jgi:predicted lactoylglutathione lyase
VAVSPLKSHQFLKDARLHELYPRPVQPEIDIEAIAEVVEVAGNLEAKALSTVRMTVQGENQEAALPKEEAVVILKKEEAIAILTKEEAIAILTKEEAIAVLTKEEAIAVLTKEEAAEVEDLVAAAEVVVDVVEIEAKVQNEVV